MTRLVFLMIKPFTFISVIYICLLYINNYV